MITPELISFIKQQLAQGMTKETITNNLASNGWNITDINEGFMAVLPPMTSSTNNQSVNLQNRPSAPVSHGSGKNLIIAAMSLIIIILGASLGYVVWGKGPSTQPVNSTVSNEFFDNANEVVEESVPVKSMSPSEQFMASSKYFDNTKNFEELAQHVRKFGVQEAASQLEYWNDSTNEEKLQMFQLVRSVAPYSNEITITGETINGNTAIVSAYAKSLDGKKSGNGTVEMRLENGEWKIYQESWEGWILSLQ